MIKRLMAKDQPESVAEVLLPHVTGEVRFASITEQLPDPKNRIQLDGRVFASMVASKPNHRKESQGAGLIIGTTRTGVDERGSVVDPGLRSHDHPNLFSLGSGTIATSSTAVPTPTIIGLMVRVVEPVLRQSRA